MKINVFLNSHYSESNAFFTPLFKLQTTKNTITDYIHS